MEEQVQVLQKLWAQPLVSFEGRWHHIPDAGLNPLPVKRKIPIWFGGHHEHVLQRVARLGDGWMPNFRIPSQAAPHLETLDKFLAKEGRARQDIGVEARLHYRDAATWEQTLAGWTALGVTHITINTMGAGLDSAKKHIEAIKEAAKRVGVGS